MTSKSYAQWQDLFENWPDIIQRRGSVVTKQGESIPFQNFLIASGLLLIDRDGPDVTGNRRVIVSYDSIDLVKLASSGELSVFQSMGFQPSI